MEMVSTSKLKRATDRVHAARPYARALADVIGRLIDPELRERYPLLRQPETVRRAAVILITSNRGLAGAFNANLIREARTLIERLRADGVEVEIHVVGKKGIGFFRSRRRTGVGAHRHRRPPDDGGCHERDRAAARASRPAAR
jgi:F-type H+-transporting ATPase subunit gamma